MKSNLLPGVYKNNRRVAGVLGIHIIIVILLFAVYPLAVSSLPLLERRRNPLISAILGYGGHGPQGGRGGVTVGLGGLLHLRQSPSSLIHRSEMDQKVTNQHENTGPLRPGALEQE